MSLSFISITLATIVHSIWLISCMNKFMFYKKLLPQVSKLYGISSLGILLCRFMLYSLVSAAHIVDQQYELAQCKWSLCHKKSGVNAFSCMNKHMDFHGR